MSPVIGTSNESCYWDLRPFAYKGTHELLSKLLTGGQKRRLYRGVLYGLFWGMLGV